MFKRGDKVEILEEFQDEGDDKFTWIVMEDEEKAWTSGRWTSP